jgi:hypothetical protein
MLHGKTNNAPPLETNTQQAILWEKAVLGTTPDFIMVLNSKQELLW